MRRAALALAALACSCDPTIEKGGDIAYVRPVTMATRPLGAAKDLAAPIPPETCVELCGYDSTEVIDQLDLSCSYGEIVGQSGVATDVIVCRGRFTSRMVDKGNLDWIPITMPDDNPNHTE